MSDIAVIIQTENDKLHIGRCLDLSAQGELLQTAAVHPCGGVFLYPLFPQIRFS